MRLGSDPEFFLVDKYGKHISVIGKVGADKWSPLQIKDLVEGFTIQEDNVAVEFGIPPASSAKDLFQNLSIVMDYGRQWFPDLDYSKLSATVFTADQMNHPAANIFGCEPDFDAWGDTSLDSEGNPQNVNPSPCPPDPFLRSAGGHIHVETTVDPAAGVRSMDLFLGVPSVLMDKGDLRKKIYGKRGAHRIKPYGFEYRVLSNFWCTEEKLCTWVWEQTERALKNVGGAEHYDALIKQAINENDKEAAKFLVNECKLELV